MQTAPRERKPSPKERKLLDHDSARAMAKGFDRYAPMEPQPVRKVEIIEDETLKRLKGLWKGFASATGPFLKQLRKVQYSASDVEKFSIVLGGFQSEADFNWPIGKAGRFLDALIKYGKDSDYVIHTAQFECALDGIGSQNAKNITVEGPVGNYLGSCMSGGTITVRGSAGNWAGHGMRGGCIIVHGGAGWQLGEGMVGGSITVNGHAGDAVGHAMKSGTITINGNAGNIVGSMMKGGTINIGGNVGKEIARHMTGGEIHIDGDIESLTTGLSGLKLFHKGVLIVDK